MNKACKMTAACCTEPYVGMPIYLDSCDSLPDNIQITLPSEPCAPSEPGMPETPTTPSTPETPTTPSTPDSGNCTCLESLALAMAYVPMQPWVSTYEPAEALQIGTVFPNLDFPFLGGDRR